jgi:flagellar biogenesis protein FliO
MTGGSPNSPTQRRTMSIVTILIIIILILLAIYLFRRVF